MGSEKPKSMDGLSITLLICSATDRLLEIVIPRTFSDCSLLERYLAGLPA